MLRFTTVCEPLSNTTVQPLPFFLIHSVKLQHKACVAAPASAMNTNSACGHVLCNKSAKRKRGEQTEMAMPGCFYVANVANEQLSGWWQLCRYSQVSHVRPLAKCTTCYIQSLVSIKG